MIEPVARDRASGRSDLTEALRGWARSPSSVIAPTKTRWRASGSSAAGRALYELMIVRLQAWFSYSLQVALNGREWPGRSLKRASARFVVDGNKFLELEDLASARRHLDAQGWPDRLGDPAVQSRLERWRDGLQWGRPKR